MEVTPAYPRSVVAYAIFLVVLATVALYAIAALLATL